MPLTDVQLKKAKCSEKNQKLFDAKGLFLFLTPAGGKLWRMKYRFAGKEKLLALGSYPETSLKEAREKCEQARRLLKDAVDPSENRKAVKNSVKNRTTNSFEVIAREWYQKFEPSWVPDHANRIIRRLEKDVFPWLGKIPIDEIEPLHLLEVMRRIENRGALETAHRALTNCGQVFNYAIQTGRTKFNVPQSLKGALPPVKENHHAAILEPEKIGELLNAIDGYAGQFIVKCALRLAPLVFVRPGELRHAEWKDIDLETAEWRFIVSKTRKPLIVPLSRQAVAILREIQPLTGTGNYVFPCTRSPSYAMSNNAVLSALRRMGYSSAEMTGNGFRAMARTLLDEKLRCRPDLIEHQLGHAVQSPLGRAYNRTSYLEERKEMMQKWADYLDLLREVGGTPASVKGGK